MCSFESKRKGSANTFSWALKPPSAPELTRAIAIAPIFTCSITTFSSPEICPPGKTSTLITPLVSRLTRRANSSSASSVG
jgi:hypothetical protein